MPYRMHVLSLSREAIPFSALQEMLEDEDLEADLKLVEDSPDGWKTFALRHPSPGLDEEGELIAFVRRWPVSEDPGASFIKYHLEELPATEPRSAIPYLEKMLPRVQVVYTFEVFGGTETEPGWEILRALFRDIRDLHDGLTYCELEGYGNEDGYHITWEFPKDVTSGIWHMALVDEEAMAEESDEDEEDEDLFCWIEFQMDLGNRKHQAAFRAGKVPPGVTPSWPPGWRPN